MDFYINMIALTGDTHNNIEDFFQKARLFEKKANRSLNKKDYLIVLGDFGFLAKTNLLEKQKLILDMFEIEPFTTLFIDGNHENFEAINNLEKINMFDGVVGKVSDHCFHLKRGHIYNINNKKILTIGGAKSIDREYRTLGIDFFEEEILNFEEENLVFDNIKLHNHNVDYVLTHTGPSFVVDYLLKKGRYLYRYYDPTDKFLWEVEKKLNYEKWYLGHFHLDIEYDKFMCLSKDVIIL